MCHITPFKEGDYQPLAARAGERDGAFGHKYLQITCGA